MHQAGLAAAAALPSEPDAGTTPTDATPEGTAEQAATAPADSFTRLDPNTLPAEVRPYYDSMQADYTRKTQEIAPTRQLQSELGLDGDGLRQAAELYNALQDPQQLVEFYNELSSALQAQGLTPAQAAAEATQHIQSTVTQQQPGIDPESLDPEERRIVELETRLQRFEQQNAAEVETRQREQMQMALVAEMNRQDSVVREQYPHFLQEDVDMVYELAPFHGGSLINAAARWDDAASARVARILNGKGAVAANAAHTQLPPALSGTTRPQGFGDDLEAAHRAALEAAARLP